MQPLSFEAVNAAIRFRNYRRYNSRTCSICESPVGYIFAASEVKGQSLVAFDGSCDCSRAFTGSHQPMAFHEFVQHFNRQTPEVRAQMWKEFTAPQPGEPLVPGEVRVFFDTSVSRWQAHARVPVDDGPRVVYELNLKVYADNETDVRLHLQQGLEAARSRIGRAIDAAILASFNAA